MALFNCTECGRKISVKAVSCPGCGCPLALMSNKRNVPPNGAERKKSNTSTANHSQPAMAVKLPNFAFRRFAMILLILAVLAGLMVLLAHVFATQEETATIANLQGTSLYDGQPATVLAVIPHNTTVDSWGGSRFQMVGNYYRISYDSDSRTRFGYAVAHDIEVHQDDGQPWRVIAVVTNLQGTNLYDRQPPAVIKVIPRGGEVTRPFGGRLHERNGFFEVSYNDARGYIVATDVVIREFEELAWGTAIAVIVFVALFILAGILRANDNIKKKASNSESKFDADKIPWFMVGFIGEEVRRRLRENEKKDGR